MDLYNIRKKLNLGYPLSSLNLKVTYYSRVSTDDIKQHISLINQIEHFDEMIKENENWIYVKGYVDDGISGTSTDKRINFIKMINDAKKSKFDLIITKEISRFSRNTLDSIMYTRKLLSYGVAVLFVNDNINTALPDSELRLTIMASMAQDEIRRLSERVKFGMKRAIKKGTILGNNMLYGYIKNNGRFIIVEEEAKVIRKIYNLYVINNYSLSKIVRILNNLNQSKKWSITGLKRIITNPKYKGYYCGGKSEVIDYMTKKVKYLSKKEWITYEDSNRITPIICEELWNKANKKISSNNRKIKNRKEYLLSSKIYCKKHNVLFYRRKQCKVCDDGTWLCSLYLKEGKKVCNSPNLREKEIYKILDQIVFNLDIDLNNINKCINNIYGREINFYIKYNKLRDVIIDLILNKIIVSKNNNFIILDIYLNLKDKIKINKTYSFKRGYNTKGTKRYIVTYQVNLFFNSEND